LTLSRPDDGLLGTGMGEQGTTQLPAPRSSPPAQGGGGKRASVARTGSLLWTAKGTDLCRLRHGAPPTAPALDRARSTRTTGASPPVGVTSQSAPRSLRGRRGVQESAAALASRGFPLLKTPSGSVPPISNRYNATTAVPQGLPVLFESATWFLCSSCQTARKCLCHRHCSVVAF
jgi:hypothetical protein